MQLVDVARVTVATAAVKPYPAGASVSRHGRAGRASCSGTAVAVLAVWVVVLLLGGFASSQLSPLLSNTFTVPGTDSEQRAARCSSSTSATARTASFTVVFEVAGRARPARSLARLQRAVDRAATAVPTGSADARCPSPARHVVYGDVVSTLDLAEAKGYTDDAARARSGSPPGVEHVYVTGAGADPARPRPDLQRRT